MDKWPNVILLKDKRQILQILTHLREDLQNAEYPKRIKKRKHFLGSVDLHPEYVYQQRGIIHASFKEEPPKGGKRAGEKRARRAMDSQSHHSELPLQHPTAAASADYSEIHAPPSMMAAASADSAIPVEPARPEPTHASENIYPEPIPEHSYSFSQRTIKQIRDDVIEQISDMIAQIEHDMFVDDRIVSVMDEYMRSPSDYMYDGVYILNIFPQQAFVAHGGEIHIATNTIIARERITTSVKARAQGKKCMHIFFDSREIFKHALTIPDWKLDMVRDFNRKIGTFDAPRYETICRNLSMAWNVANGIQIVDAIDAEPTNPFAQLMQIVARMPLKISISGIAEDDRTVALHQSYEHNGRIFDRMRGIGDIPAEPASPTAPPHHPTQ